MPHKWASLYADHQLDLQQVRDLRRTNLVAAQAFLLLQLDEGHIARAIAKCDAPGRSCKQRFCPSCSSRWHAQHSRRMLDAYDQMSNPHPFLLRLFSSSLSVPSLTAALSLLSRSWSTLKRRAVMKGIVRLAGMIEVSVVTLEGGRRWCVHLHAIADLSNFDEDRAQADWKEVTRQKNAVLGVQTIRTRKGFVQYATKTRDRCPEAGTLRPAWLLKVLVRAMKGRQMWVEWGDFTKRGKHRVRVKRVDPPRVSYDDHPEQESAPVFATPRRRRKAERTWLDIRGNPMQHVGPVRRALRLRLT